MLQSSLDLRISHVAARKPLHTSPQSIQFPLQFREGESQTQRQSDHPVSHDVDLGAQGCYHSQQIQLTSPIRDSVHIPKPVPLKTPVAAPVMASDSWNRPTSGICRKISVIYSRAYVCATYDICNNPDDFLIGTKQACPISSQKNKQAGIDESDGETDNPSNS